MRAPENNSDGKLRHKARVGEGRNERTETNKTRKHEYTKGGGKGTEEKREGKSSGEGRRGVEKRRRECWR